ncbi:MAG: hypothetical protein JEZ05_00200 [Tenericutes bacterium]|nr:hypothetical protein [Mycoplasmatota bacterium]
MKKPRIYALQGYLIVTAIKTLSEFEAEYEVLETTNINTALGLIVIVKIIKEGNVLIAGPSVISDIEKTLVLLEKYDLKNVFIDGAFFRHSLAKTSEITILVIGANLSPNIDLVVKDAEAIVKKFNLKTVPNELKKLEKYDNVCLVNEQNKIEELNINSIIGNTVNLFDKNNVVCKFIYSPKALTNDFVKKLIEERRDFKFDIVVKSPVDIQLNLDNIINLFKLENQVFVLNPINLKAICYNPTSPQGYEFNSLEFSSKLEKILGTKVINVMEGNAK